MGGDPKCDGHKLPCLFEAGEYEAHYMTTGSKERIFPHTFVFDRSLDAVGGGRVDVLRCSVCDYTVPVKSHVHDYGWNWDCTGFGSIYEYTFNIGGSTKTVEELIIESDYAHPEKCKVPGCEEFIMVPHSWGRWNVVKNPDTEGGRGGMEAECSICEYTKTKIDKDDDGGADQWTKDTALVTVKNGRATRMIVKPGDKIRLYPEERTGQKAIGWKVEYRREYNEYDIIPVTRNWNTNEAKTLFKLVTNGSALEWGCTIPEFSTMGAPGGGSFFFEPVYAGCDHSGGTTVLNAKEQICDRKGYTGDTACADCGHVISAGSDIYPPANAGHTGPLQPLYYYGTANSATTDASHGGKRYNAKSGDCRHRAYEGDYRCTACGGTVKGETGDFRHSGPLELRDVRTATCTERGYSGSQYCTSCDRIAHKGVSTPSLHEIADNYKLINEVKPGCTTSGYSGDQQCTAGCGQIIRYGHVVNKLSHDWDGGKPAKQGKSEGILYTCQRADCGETRFVKNSAATGYIVTVIKGTASLAAGTLITDKIAQNTVVTVTADAPEVGKVFDKWVVLEGNVTLADATKATTTFTMPGNDVKLEATYKDAPPSHTHSYGTEWKYDDTDHWHECECGDKANIAAHSASEWIVDTAATETADGAKHKECTVCKKVLETAPIPATGSNHTHSYGTVWKYDGTNHWHECECGDKADTAAHSFQWVIDKAATKEATGIKHEECTVCGAKRSENTVIDKLPDGGNTDNTGSSDNNTNKPGNDDSTKCPQTGDSSNHIGWLAALCGVLTLLGVSGKKRKESKVK
ncbi:InlB B-repeat-containing protein [Ruminococcus sp.]|uniref:InlB B-repeat-containing protein n=1 Tax=Ruminococcus sp. TaxID=41978 RepID=UPI003967296A